MVPGGHRQSVGVKKTTRMRKSRTAPSIAWAIRGLCIVGLGVSGYLSWVYISGAEPYCGGSYGCSDVRNSVYASLFGVPIPLIGACGYLCLLLLDLLAYRGEKETEFLLRMLSFGAALFGVLYSGYLTYLEAFVIRSWCYWCVCSALAIAGILVLSSIELSRTWRHLSDD